MHSLTLQSHALTTVLLVHFLQGAEDDLFPYLDVRGNVSLPPPGASGTPGTRRHVTHAQNYCIGVLVHRCRSA
jgi:hypothetical protein